MIKINLLPEYRRKTEFPTWKLYRIVAYVFLGLSILLWGYHLAMFKYTESRVSEVNEGIASIKRSSRMRKSINAILSYAIFLKTVSSGAAHWQSWAMLHLTAVGLPVSSRAISRIR